MKRLLLLGMTLAMLATASAQITQISSTKLPATARNMVKSTWNNAPIVDAWRNKEGRKVEYKTSIENGAIVKFNANGQWIEVKCYDGVPNRLFPATLIKFVNDYYEGQFIVWGLKTANKYQVLLSDNSKLEFNKKGQFQAFL